MHSRVCHESLQALWDNEGRRVLFPMPAMQGPPVPPAGEAKGETSEKGVGQTPGDPEGAQQAVPKTKPWGSDAGGGCDAGGNGRGDLKGKGEGAEQGAGGGNPHLVQGSAGVEMGGEKGREKGGGIPS